MNRSRFALSFGAKLDLDLVVGERAPAAAEALVTPQDVNLIMGDVEPVEDTQETAEEVLAAAPQQQARRPGSIVVSPGREGVPLLLQAVVYDFQESPPARVEHVFEALLTAFEVARARKLTCMAVRPLGTAHAGLDSAAFLRILTQICYSSAELGTTLRRVHVLLGSPEELGRYEDLLHELMPPRRA